jgi:hypothetical protein
MILDNKILISIIIEKYGENDIIIKNYDIIQPLSQNNWLGEDKLIIVRYFSENKFCRTTIKYDYYITYCYKLRKMKLDSL